MGVEGSIPDSLSIPCSGKQVRWPTVHAVGAMVGAHASQTCVPCAVVQAGEVLQPVQRYLMRGDAQLVL